ncbi:bifunctional UDP-N-acetylglucosamine diphosphorylase/glucosamine-1-phosphate N-acetyltransferase GlmU [Blochmannia endosymbiont of Polyrhachis (Hedomyrma) turneri]|uniref:bifunctional UDP-N-acetylglucosamine diphosphorylase/glucosamine-1-phosphate N-acetyltransferase GlmU n=1 Tax=Blochmannia endosymbiont of Polyrhachis (Hedomyrma) turneri TaxID=1505596 RepID=UPI00061A7A1F|nr:bifunctional UDP-N-acetylglucosamine diphosphorylase/glucosamine-1-phosphate N-acetyltransferase GlmU [Blochmannia endosymbiont of Polyrhachis (Hedomyrma) turneri]AKC59606.1 Bifunctional protein GlmU [Blochmannia endosymbiont of Polyrhachis (Hedomyrma) turneri]
MLCKIFSTIILAAGKGRRMCSNIPKVLHRIGGKFVLQYVIDTAIRVGSKDIYVVYSDDYGKNILKDTLGAQNNFVDWVLQNPVCGTGHAVNQVLSFLSDDIDILILYGDVPFVSPYTLRKLFDAKPVGGVSLLTAFLRKNSGYGRIIRQNGKVSNIIEDSDLTEDQKDIHEVNTGVMVVTGRDLKRWVNCIKCVNANREFYLTDIIHMAWLEDCTVNTVFPKDNNEVSGVNNKLQLVELERIYQKKQAEFLLSNGVFLSDIYRFSLRGKLYHGDDVYIDVNVVIEGTVCLGNRVNIGIGCILKNSVVYDDVVIYPYSLIDGVKISSHSIVGPFARLRAGSELGSESVIGNFVELKNTRLGEKSKINHVSYMGDADIGNMVNIGAGVISCNYDGFDKHKTVIDDNAFVGADSQLVAPVTIGAGAKIGAGTTVTRDVLPDEMIISRVRQFPITSWKRILKKDNGD